uniref:Selenocysteine lyase n=1 Tax=Timema californicum TaxID=61474 RepID=A0A7R9J9W4_TIMCA|nr:unnamed protein product [Timema californicum]
MYLDYNATTPIAPSVALKIINSLKNEWGNPSSKYPVAEIALKSITYSRMHLSKMIGADLDDIIFTSGGTEANNMAILGALDYFKDWEQKCNTFVKGKPHIITTNVEHDATILPIKHLERKGLIECSVVSVSSDGCICPEEILAQIRPLTCLITVMMANNETGVIMPVAVIGRHIKDINRRRKLEGLIEILYHSDAAQAIGKIPVDVLDLQVDYLTIVGHKFYGPRVGCLYARGAGKATPVYPLLFGGAQERGFRPGTENTPMIAGLGEAARLVCENLDSYYSHMLQMRDYLEEQLKHELGESRVIFNCHNKTVMRLPNTCNVSFVGVGLTGQEILSRCKHIMASTGAACHAQDKPSGVLIASQIPPHVAASAIRFSVGRETTKTEIEEAVQDLKQAIGIHFEHK